MASSPLSSSDKLARRESFYKEMRGAFAQRLKGLDTLSAEACFNVVQTYHLAETAMLEQINKIGVTLSGLNVLLILKHHGEKGCSQNTLSHLLIVSRANITGLIDSLVRKNLVKREESAEDRRIVITRLTKKGEELVDSYMPTHFGAMQSMTSSLGKDEKKTLIRILTKMRQHIVHAALVMVILAGTARADTTLTMEQAIHLAIQNNLTSKLAKAGTEAARGKAIQDTAGLLPQFSGAMSQTRQFKTNLAAEGFGDIPIPGFFPVIGPYNIFDARLYLTQTLFNANAFWKMREGRAGKRIAALQEDLAREQVATAAALAYLEAQRAERAVAAAQADLTLSDSLLKLARDQHVAGISTGIDVARAETERAQENLRLIRAQVSVHQADLRLKRVVGLPLDQPVSLPDLPRVEITQLPAEDQAVGQAGHDRYELQIDKENVEAIQDSVSAAKAEHLPTITAMADYGHSGTTINNTARTGSIGGRLDLPIFAGGEAHGHVVEETAREKEAEDLYQDTNAQVEEDVRLALQTLTAEIEETHTADQAADLSRKELKMAQDRFSAGVGDNIQVLNAQTALARALDDQVDAFARYDIARVNLAAALGHMQDFK
jgi:outer membrane protein TolC/DNA-binding MarR family transcriptional regulator